MSTPGRIYLLSNGFQPEYEIAFANGLRMLWPEVVLVASDNTLASRAQPALTLVNWRGSQKEERSGLAKAANLLSYWRHVAVAMWRDRSAIFHFNGLFTFSHPLFNLAEALAIRLLCRHWWLSVHNIAPHDGDTPLRRAVNRLIYRMPDRLLVHTPRMKDELARRWGVDARRIVCIRHGIDRPIVADAEAVTQACRAYGIDPQGRPLLLCFGNIAPYKGADLMLQALPLARCHDKVGVVVLGRVRDKAFFNCLLALASQAPVSARVQVIDTYVADEHVSGVLGAAAAMVLPYRHIDQSGVLFTARAAALPVIATPVGGIGDELLDGVDQLVDGCSPAALAKAIDQWYDRWQAARRYNAERSASMTDGLLWHQTLVPYREAAQRYLHLDD